MARAPQQSVTTRLYDLKERVRAAMSADLFEQEALSPLNLLLLVDELIELVQEINDRTTGDNK